MSKNLKWDKNSHFLVFTVFNIIRILLINQHCILRKIQYMQLLK